MVAAALPLMEGFAVECLRLLFRVVEVLVEGFLEVVLGSSLCFPFP